MQIAQKNCGSEFFQTRQLPRLTTSDWQEVQIILGSSTSESTRCGEHAAQNVRADRQGDHLYREEVILSPLEEASRDRQNLPPLRPPDSPWVDSG